MTVYVDQTQRPDPDELADRLVSALLDASVESIGAPSYVWALGFLAGVVSEAHADTADHVLILLAMRDVT